jgi:hypothetical protein
MTLDGTERFDVEIDPDGGGGSGKEKFIGGSRLKNGGYGLLEAVDGTREVPEDLSVEVKRGV